MSPIIDCNTFDYTAVEITVGTNGILHDVQLLCLVLNFVASVAVTSTTITKKAYQNLVYIRISKFKGILCSNQIYVIKYSHKSFELGTNKFPHNDTYFGPFAKKII